MIYIKQNTVNNEKISMDNEIDLVSLPKKSYWKLSLPLIAFSVFNAIYGLIDMLWISQISIEATFAVGISIPFVSLIFSIGDAIGQGTNSIMSRFIGADDYESGYNALIHGMLLGNLVWALCIFCLFFANGILFYLDQADSYIMVFEYLVPIVIFAYIFIFVNIFSETLQAEGNSTLPSALIIVSNILNIILDPIFIFNLNLGVIGAAYSTVIAGLPSFFIILYFYLSGRAKIPLSLKYFKFKSYIIVEIIKVALPNFLYDGLWAFSASFINSILIMTTGEIGPVLYSVTHKINNLLQSPVKGYGRGLMSISGHLFGARKFDNLEKMFYYVLKVSLITIIIEAVVFIIFRNYIYAIFSITGMDTAIFWIAIGVSVALFSLPFSLISSKMLDGFGKSMYSLYITFIKIVFEMGLIYVLNITFSSGYCVLIGIVISEIVTAFIYYIFLKYLFKNFDEHYSKKDTVETFNNKNADETAEKPYTKILKNIPIALALISLGYGVLKMFSLLLQTHDHTFIITILVIFILGMISIYLMERLDKPKLSLLGFFLLTVITFIFMNKYDYTVTILFATTSLMAFFIKILFRDIIHEVEEDHQRST